MSKQSRRIAQALENIEHQFLALNEWLTRYGETQLEPPLPSTGIHLVKFREPTREEREYGRMLAAEIEARQRAAVLQTLMFCDQMFRQVTCPIIPAEGTGWIVEVDDEDPGIGHMRMTSDGRARRFMGASVSLVRMDDESDVYGWIYLRRFLDGKVFDCRLVVSDGRVEADEKGRGEPAGKGEGGRGEAGAGPAGEGEG